jgi:hypothetical protein
LKAAAAGLLELDALSVGLGELGDDPQPAASSAMGRTASDRITRDRMSSLYRSGSASMVTVAVTRL